MEFSDLLSVAAINSSIGVLGLLNHVGLQVKAWPKYTDEEHEIWLKSSGLEMSAFIGLQLKLPCMSTGTLMFHC